MVRSSIERKKTASYITFLCVYLVEVKLELRNLAEKLRKAREDDDFIETDLHLWTNNLKILKAHVLDVHSSVVTIREDPSVQLIAKLNVISTSKQFEFDKRLIIAYEDVSIEDNGCLAIQQCFGTSYLRSKNGFSFGQYKVRFNIITSDLGYDIIFGVISTKELLSEWPSTNYGWSTHDSIVIMVDKLSMMIIIISKMI